MIPLLLAFGGAMIFYLLGALSVAMYARLTWGRKLESINRKLRIIQAEKDEAPELAMPDSSWDQALYDELM